MKPLSLAINNKPEGPATVAEIAAHNFYGAKELLSEKERTERLREIFDELYQIAIFSDRIIMFDKTELVERVRQCHEAHGNYCSPCQALKNWLRASSNLSNAPKLDWLWLSPWSRAETMTPEGGEDIPAEAAA
jgi:hypothetical protein